MCSATGALRLAAAVAVAWLIVAVPCRADWWTTDGTVSGLAPGPAGSVFVGGGFGAVGPAAGGWVVLDAASGRRDTTWPAIDGSVRCVAPDGSGGWFLGGTFRHVGDTPRPGLAHVRSDRSVDAAWSPGLDGPPDAMAVNGPTVYLAAAG